MCDFTMDDFWLMRISFLILSFLNSFIRFAPFTNRCAIRDSASLIVQSSLHLALCPILFEPFPQNGKDYYFKIEEETLVFDIFVVNAHLSGVEDLIVESD